MKTNTLAAAWTVLVAVCGCSRSPAPADARPSVPAATVTAAQSGMNAASAPMVAADGGMCGGIAGITCAPGSYCAMGFGQCAVADGAGVCKKKPKECAVPPGTPVCGCDGKTYADECAAAIAGVRIDSPGACK